MHQLQCGVAETIVIDGYLVEILEVSEDAVTVGVSTRGNEQRVHQISLPCKGAVTQTSREQLTTR
jgi:hypothetical protein